MRRLAIGATATIAITAAVMRTVIRRRRGTATDDHRVFWWAGEPGRGETAPEEVREAAA